MTVEAFDLHEYRRERSARLERENSFLRAELRKAVMVIGLLCRDAGVLAELEHAVELVIAREDALRSVRRRLPDLLAGPA